MCPDSVSRFRFCAWGRSVRWRVIVCAAASIGGVCGPLGAEIRLAELASAVDEPNDSDGDASDWIEIENTEATPVDVGGFRIGDDTSGEDGWILPSPLVLEALGRLVIFASGKDRHDSAELHADFRLDRDGETIFLAERSGAIVDLIRLPVMVPGVSFGRDSRGTWRYLLVPSRGAPNDDRAAVDFVPERRPRIEPPGGIYPASLEVTVRGSLSEVVVRYTLDGSTPEASSPEASQFLRVSSTTVVRAAAFFGEHRVGEVASATFLIDEDPELDVVSISTAPANLFDPTTGIYVNPESRGREWERPVSFEVLTKEGRRLVATGAGLRVHGQSTRLFPKKSLRLHFRGEYGSTRLSSRIFDEAGATNGFESLVLLMGTELAEGPDQVTYIHRALLQPLFGSLGGQRLHFRPISLWLDGEYWGLYILSERPDESFASSYFGGERGEWDVVEGLDPTPHVVAGNREEWTKLYRSLERGEFAGEDGFDELGRQVDIENLTDYLVLFVWGMFADEGVNLRAARRRSPDGRWRIVPWDANAFRRSDDPLAVDIVGRLLRARSGDILSLLFSTLHANEEYRQLFHHRLRAAIDGPLSPAEFAKVVDELAARIAPEMARESERWGLVSPEEWRSNIDRLRDYAEWRRLTLPRASGKWFDPLVSEDGGPPPLPRGRGIVVLCPDDGPRQAEELVASRLRAAGASVSFVASRGALASDLAEEFDLAVLLSGAGSVSFSTTFAQSALPLVVTDGEFLRSGVHLSPVAGETTIEAVQVVETSNELLDDLPLWSLAFATTPVDAVVPLGGLGEGLEAPVVQMRPRVGRSSNRVLVLGEEGDRYYGGELLHARLAYLAANDVDRLSGYGWLLFDRAVLWAAGDEAPELFVRGDVNGDGVVQLDDVVQILSSLFRAGAQGRCVDASDANDDGHVDISDAVAMLRYLYGTAVLPEPFPVRGEDPTLDPLPCAED